MVSPNSKARGLWKPKAKAESRKLNSSNGWCLPGSTVPSIGKTRRQSKAMTIPTNDNDNNDISTTPSTRETATMPTMEIVTCGSDDTPSTLTGSHSAGRGKPADKTRVIVESQQLKNIIEKHTFCPHCKSPVVASLPTCCIATNIRIQCTNELCTFVAIERPASADFPLPVDAGSPLITRTTDFAINILFVLSFMWSGDGGMEAGRLCGLLGLPKSTSMQSAFGDIEKMVSPQLKAICDKVIRGNLEREVKHLLGDKIDNDGVLLFDLWKQKQLPQQLWPRVRVAGDMGWSGRSSGHSYNSLSGHACLVSEHHREPIIWCIKSKHCCYCKSWNRRHTEDEQVPEHACSKNWDGSSGSMEPQAILDMVVRLNRDEQVIVDTIVTDDDSAIKAKCKWSNADHCHNNNTDEIPMIINRNGNLTKRPDKGMLPSDMEEPKFLADPNHRKRTLKGELYRLVNKKVADRHTLTKCDVLRISMNFAYMARTLKEDMTDDVIVERAKAVLEHHFDNHEHCGDWCRRKPQYVGPITKAEHRSRRKKYYRNKERDTKLYNLLQQKLARFVAVDALREVCHDMDTNKNESLNNTIAWIAPKNKVYSGTASLSNRICIALCVTSLGVLPFFEEVFKQFGIVMTDDVRHYLEGLHLRRAKRIAKTKTTAGKKKRSKKFHDKLIEHTVVAKRERKKRQSTYKSGVGMDGGYSSDDDNSDKDKATASKKKPTAPGTDMSKYCKRCEQHGHSRASSKLCKHYKPKRGGFKSKDKATPQQTAHDEKVQTERDADELDVLDEMPLVDDCCDSSDFFSAEEYSGSSSAKSSSDNDEGGRRGIV